MDRPTQTPTFELDPPSLENPPPEFRKAASRPAFVP